MKKDHDFVVEFIEVYKSFPCLWDKKNAHYHNFNFREAAYNLLLGKYKEFDQKATKAMVKSKINCLRSTYNKEFKKVKLSERSAARTDEVYKPSLWYYDLLSFVSDQKSALASISSMDDDDNQETEDSKSIIDSDEKISISSSNQELTRSTPSSSAGENNKSLNQKMLKLVTERLKKANDASVGKHDSFAKYVIDELNNMPLEMIPHVKKLISLAIFDGHMKTLNSFSSIVTPQVADQTQNHFSSLNSQNSLIINSF